MNPPRPPRRRLKVTITLGADDWNHVDRLLKEIKTDFYFGNMRLGGASGAGYSIAVDEDATAPTGQEYIDQLIAWSKAKQAERRAQADQD